MEEWHSKASKLMLHWMAVHVSGSMTLQDSVTTLRALSSVPLLYLWDVVTVGTLALYTFKLGGTADAQLELALGKYFDKGETPTGRAECGGGCRLVRRGDAVADQVAVADVCAVDAGYGETLAGCSVGIGRLRRARPATV